VVGNSKRVGQSRQLGFARILADRVAGEVLTDDVSRHLYATDASNYEIVPDVVLRAARSEDLQAAVETAAEFDVTITPRGAGTGTAGGAVGNGLLVDTFCLDRLELDVGIRRAVVDAGVIQSHLDRAAGAHGLTFGPDTASADRATLGGMVANNSAGARSIVYGQTRHRLEWAEVILADGAIVTLGPTRDGDLTTGIAGLPRDRTMALTDALEGIRERAAPLVAQRYPKILRHVDGYALDELCSDQPNLSRVLCGSEGTLGLFSRLGLLLDDRPAARALAVLSFARLEEALASVPELLELGPSAVEILDGRLAMAAGDGTAFTTPEAGAVLFVEFQGEDGEPEARLALLPHIDTAGRVDLIEPPAQHAAWRLRERALGSGLPIAEPGMPPYFVEDTAVDPSRLAAYASELRRIVDSFGIPMVLWGHASVGCLHMQPFVNIKTANGVHTMEAMAREVLALVSEFHGALSGEHGNGLARSQWLESYFGPELVAEMRRLKHALDPTGRMNPGKIVDPDPMTAHLRYGASYRPKRPTASPVDFSMDQGGYVGAVERCFGAGVCKKARGGTMCPPAMVTGEERLTTRARANVLRSVVSGAMPIAALSSTQVREVMELCIGCKACKTECPVGVDMAKLKTDWLWRMRTEHGARWRDRAVAHLRPLSAAAAPVAPLVNRALRSALGRRVLKGAGIASERTLPRLAGHRLSRRMKADSEPDVVVFADCFAEFQEPEVGESAVRVLRAGGLRVAVVDPGCCGRVMLSVGFVESARRSAERAVRRLLPHARAGRRVVVLEPSCASAILDDWRWLVRDRSGAAEVEAATSPVEDVLAETAGLQLSPGRPVLLHGHCHQKALWGTGGTVRALEMVPGSLVRETDAGCCGMAGFFGYARERAAMSRRIAEHGLLPAIGAAGDVDLVAPGVSCRHQILDLTGRRALHPMEYLASRLKGEVPQ
jgi:FAD/FMN-containing dehydrogenase/Fe-S oxidoreductase